MVDIFSGEQAINTSVILGATSAVAQALARELAQRGEPMVLVARNADNLSVVESDLAARGAQVRSVVADFDQVDAHEQLISDVGESHTFWLFYGSLPDQERCESSWEETAAALQTNFISAASLLTRIASLCEQRSSGHIVVVSSVAGDRGRKSNYVYGTAKGALSLFCQGIRNRLSPFGVHVLTVKPGFIDTPMTADIPKTPGVLWASPERVAADMLKARDKKREILYTPWFWQGIMLIIRVIPETIFKRLSI